MKRKIIYGFAAILSVLIFFSSGCTKDLEEINTNPNDPGISQAAPNMLLTNAIESMTDRVHEIFLGHEMGSCWVQHMAKVQYPDEDRYVPRISVINNTWTSFYASSGYDVQTILNIAEASGNDSYKAVGLILKSYIVSVLTDEFGDVPYTEAWMGSGETSILSPVYDTQESIYAALLINLTTANELLTDDSPDIEGDILFGNDLTMWKKFANSLRLRLLMRRSDRVDPTADMTAIVSDPVTYPIFEGIEDNAALAYLGSAPNNHPINENRKTRDDHRVSKTLVDYMYTNANIDYDYRIFAYAEPASGPNDFVGLPNGMTSSAAAAYNGNGIANTSEIGSYFSSATAPGMLMSYPELQFILAEAAARGFLSGTPDLVTAETYYTEGVTSSTMTYAKEIAAGIGNFYGYPEDFFMSGTGDPGTDPLIWFLEGDGAFDSANALEQIATQKWVALFDQGLQAAFEWRRTGFPVLTPAIAGKNDGKIPVRAYYPSDEAGRNPTNLAAAIANQGPNDLNTRVWWDIKDNY
ncbi:MAG TPA: SusD/RagB family nutrient-binding outer membrane lipoprotein [Bacteroidales bacterium]|nr:SusD/RagB family nutrient-binding outer membrane lipoprotein [Bacteroidales bacterium]